MQLFNTAANYRALREICGVTQQQVADVLGVSVLTVKKWEKGVNRVPDDALSFIREAAAEHTRAVRTEAAEAASSAQPGSALCLTYYRTQEQADLEAGLTGEAAGPYQFLNAVRRSVGERLIDMGYLVSFKYPDEERIEVKRA